MTRLINAMRINYGTPKESQSGRDFMTKINREETIKKLKEIQHARTHCQCSRDKVIEKVAFDYAIKVVEMMPDDE